jgi:hypothetical protein
MLPVLPALPAAAKVQSALQRSAVHSVKAWRAVYCRSLAATV